MKNFILLGAGGHCKSAIEVIESNRNYHITGILDIMRTGDFCGYPILGNDDLISKYSMDNLFLVTVGSIKSTKIREKLVKKIIDNHGLLGTAISNQSIISKRALIGAGSIVFNNVHINSDSKIGNNCILNTCCNIEHDCIIDDFVHISTGTMINGDCKIGKRCFIGSNSTIANGISICDDAIIGCGTVIIKDIIEPGTYVGNPARKIK